MNYVEYINKTLKPRVTEKEVVLDLFAGCGGLSLGFEAAGYKTIGFEMDKAAAETYNQNLDGDCHAIKLEVGFEYPDAEIIIGGPPCQPFSVGGHQKGIEDARDGFPIFIDAVKRLQPKVFMFENVRGLLYTNKWYFELVIEELRKLGYLIDYKLLNAVNFGVPQNRERLFVFGHKAKFSFPKPHLKKITVSEAIGDIMFTTPPESKFLNASMDAYVAKYEKASFCIISPFKLVRIEEMESFFSSSPREYAHFLFRNNKKGFLPPEVPGEFSDFFSISNFSSRRSDICDEMVTLFRPVILARSDLETGSFFIISSSIIARFIFFINLESAISIVPPNLFNNNIIRKKNQLRIFLYQILTKSKITI